MITFSCNKDSFNYKPGYVGSSKITYYADVEVTGDTYMAVPLNGTYTEQGATATANGKTLKVTTTGTVNTSQVGVYLVNYSAINTDGFPATVTRYVAVYSTDASAQSNDFSGTYARTTNGVTATWTKIAPGVYVVENPGGAPGVNLQVIAFNPTGYTIHIPQQIAGGSPTSSTAEVTVPGTTPGTLAKYSWKIVNPGYGPSLRTFVKQ